MSTRGQRGYRECRVSASGRAHRILRRITIGRSNCWLALSARRGSTYPRSRFPEPVVDGARRSIIASLSAVALRGQRVEVEDVARLTLELPTERIKCRKAHCPRLAGLENGEIGECYSDPFTELCQRHVTVGQYLVESHVYAHDASDSEVGLFTQLRSLAEHLCQNQHHEDQEQAHEIYWVV